MPPEGSRPLALESAQVRALSRPLLTLAYALVVLAPLVAVALHIRPPLLPDARQAALLARSIAFSAAVALLTTALGTAVALGLRPRAAGWLAVVVPVPPALLAAAWAAALSLAAPGLADGYTVALLVEAASLLPLAAGLAWIALRSVPRDLVEAARLLAPDGARRVLLPLAAPLLAACGGLVFAVSLLDYETPSLFRVHVYAMEVFVAYGAAPGQGLASAVTTALPLILAATAALLPALAALRRLDLDTGPAFKSTPSGRAAPAFLALAVLVPVVLLAAAARTAHLPPAAWEDLARTLLTAAAAALLCLPLGWTAARALETFPALAWPAVVVPLAVPPSLLGLGLLTILNNALTAPLLDSSSAFVLADLARFTPAAALLLFAARKRSDPALLEAAQLLQRDAFHGFSRVTIPLVLPALGAAAALTFSLSVGEVPAAVLVAPPGAATLPLRLYNLLHYGATPEVAALALVLLLTCLACGLALRAAWREIR